MVLSFDYGHIRVISKKMKTGTSKYKLYSPTMQNIQRHDIQIKISMKTNYGWYELIFRFSSISSRKSGRLKSPADGTNGDLWTEWEWPDKSAWGWSNKNVNVKIGEENSRPVKYFPRQGRYLSDWGSWNWILIHPTEV